MPQRIIRGQPSWISVLCLNTPLRSYLEDGLDISIAIFVRRISHADKNAVCLAVYAAHESHLMASLLNVALVDADIISPKESSLVGQSRSHKGPMQSGGDLQGTSRT